MGSCNNSIYPCLIGQNGALLYFQFLHMPQGDQLDDYTVFLYCYTLILYCVSSTWIRALFDDRSNLHFLNICLCNALPENCLILSSLVFSEPGCYNSIHIRVIHVLLFWYKYLTFFLVFISLRYTDVENKNIEGILVNEVRGNFG